MKEQIQSKPGKVGFVSDSRKSVLLLILLSLLLTSFSCQESTSPPEEISLPQMALTGEYAAVTESWINLSLKNIHQREQIEIYRNGGLRFSLWLEDDTLLYDNTLQPDKTYQYRAYLLRDGKAADSVETTSLTTLDTTSFDYSTQVFYFGDRSQSDLNDVFILSPTNIWAVGEINTQETDSLGNWVDAYNAVHWDGSDWELHRIEYSYGNYSNPIIPIRGIWAFNDRNIWYASGSIFHFNGDSTKLSFIRNTETPEIAGKLWAYDSTMIVSVGTEGLAVYYNGHNWHRITTNSTESINDVWGCVDPATGERTILACATHAVYDLSTLKDALWCDWPYPEPWLVSLWFKSKYKLYTVGDGIFRHTLGQGWTWEEKISTKVKTGIRGIDYNDIFLVGHFGLIARFNGMRWRVFPDLSGASYNEVKYQDGLAVAVGWAGTQAAIVMMERN